MSAVDPTGMDEKDITDALNRQYLGIEPSPRPTNIDLNTKTPAKLELERRAKEGLPAPIEVKGQNQAELEKRLKAPAAATMKALTPQQTQNQIELEQLSIDKQTAPDAFTESDNTQITNPLQVDLESKLQRDYPSILRPKKYYADFTRYEPNPVPFAPFPITGIFILVGPPEKPEKSEQSLVGKTGGVYGLIGYSGKEGIYAGLLGEAGMKGGPVKLTGGGAQSIAYSKEKGVHYPREAIGSVEIGGGGYGVGAVWELHQDPKEPLLSPGNLVPPFITDKQGQGEVSPYIFGQLFGLTLGIGVDVHVDRSRQALPGEAFGSVFRH
jgi:hypothetical protein